jgi:hypothetical protein
LHVEFIKSTFSKLIRCVFIGNNATALYSKGGAIRYILNSSNAVIVNSIFTGNTAYAGGAIISFCDDTSISNCDFQYNDALTDGGAIVFIGRFHFFYIMLEIQNNFKYHVHRCQGVQLEQLKTHIKQSNSQWRSYSDD